MRTPNRAFTGLFLWLAGITVAQAQGLLDRDGWSPGWGYGHMMFGGVMMFAFWGGLIVLLVLLVRWLGSDGGVMTAAPIGRMRCTSFRSASREAK